MGEITLSLKNKPKKATIRDKALAYDRINVDYLTEAHVSMFDYNKLPVTVNTFFLEKYLQQQGLVVWLKDKRGDIIAIEGTRAGDLDVYGLGRDVIAVTRNGESYHLKSGIDCIVGYNNLSMTPCSDIYTDAVTLADIRTSIDFLIFWTRLSPFIRTADDKTKEQIIAAFQNMKKGIPVTIAAKKILSDFGINDDIVVESLTQPDFADKIQYTSKLYDDVIRWHFTKYGQAMNGDGKAAQISVDEANSTVSQSLILPLAMLRARRAMVEEVNALFGTEITVNLSGAWRAEVTNYENETGEASIDDTPDDLSAPPGAKTIENDDSTDIDTNDEEDNEK